MHTTDLREEIREALSAWQALRKVGFPASAIFTGALDGQVIVQVRGAPGAFNLRVMATELTPEEWGVLWADAADVLEAIPQDELDAMYRDSKIAVAFWGLAVELAVAGLIRDGKAVLDV